MSDIYYQEYGEGHPLVLIHGFCENGIMWREVASELSRHYRVIVPDLPGFGESPLTPIDFSIDDIGQFIAEWMMGLDIPKATVIGHSLGGYVTLALANKYPHLLDKIGLFHSTALEDSNEKKENRNKTIQFIQKYGPQVFAESFAPSLFYHGNRQAVINDVHAVVDMASKVSVDALVKYTIAMRDRPDRTDVLSSFERAVLFIAGEYDTAVPLEKVEQQINLPKQPVVHILKDTGHMGMFERKDECVRIINDFLSL